MMNVLWENWLLGLAMPLLARIIRTELFVTQKRAQTKSGFTRKQGKARAAER